MKRMLVVITCLSALRCFSQQGYGEMVALYRAGQLPVADKGKLALQAAKMEDPKLADSLSRDYSDQYLAGQPDTVLLNRDNLDFIGHFPGLIHAGDRYFTFFYADGAALEKEMGWRSGYTHE